jgi:hypothetical protein
LLIEKALTKEEELGVNPKEDRIWFVIDTDRWGAQLHEIRQECEQHPHWAVVQSNPCFEVWLYFHAKPGLPQLSNIALCSNWKSYLPNIIQGGFNSDFHPVSIEAAITNSKSLYVANGYLPEPGSTQLWQLGEELLPLIKKDLDNLKDKFPPPKLIG